MTSNFNKNRMRNFFIGMSISCSLSLYAFTYKVVPTEGIIHTLSEKDFEESVKVISVQFEQPKAPEERPKQTKRTQETFRLDAKIELVDNNTLLPKPILAPKTIPTSITPPSLTEPASAPTTTAYLNVDVRPSFPGGDKALQRYLKDNLNYESNDYDNEDGRIRVLFIVDEEGRITNIEILENEVNPAAEEAVIEVLKSMPNWTPGIKAGTPVKTYFVQPFIFRSF